MGDIVGLTSGENDARRKAQAEAKYQEAMANKEKLKQEKEKNKLGANTRSVAERAAAGRGSTILSNVLG